MKYGDITKCEKCGSDNVKVVKYIISNGKEQYRHQCFNCGFVDASSIKFDSIPKDVDIPLLDDNLRKWYNSKSAMESREDFFSILKNPCLVNLSPLEFRNNISLSLFFKRVFLYTFIYSSKYLLPSFTSLI